MPDKPKPVTNAKSKGVKGTSLLNMPPASGAFAPPPPEPAYYEDNGLRKVKPYMYAFQSWAKERWQNRTVIDVYSDWVRDRSTEYYEWAIATGTIVVNNAPTTPDTIIGNGDLIGNIVHRHEPPVVAGPIKIIYDGRLPGNDGKTLVVEKPGSMPVHSTGRYHFNTLLSILKYDYDLPLVHTSNRLDRLTSGVMICALTVEASKELGHWFGGRRATEGGVKKEYVARCIGEFPEEEIICEEPLLTIDRQIGINVVHPDGRDAKTIFNRMSYHRESNTSVIHCKPITGRSHQIRVHLQFLGYPIANDPVYQNSAAWGDNMGKGGVFGGDRGGTAEQRQARRDMGDHYMSVRKEELAQDGALPNVDGLSLSEPTAKSTEIALNKKSHAPSIYNKQGRLRTDIDSPAASASASTSTEALTPQAIAELDRKPHDAELTPGAIVAITELRKTKDKADGWARKRDLDGVEMARKCETGGLLSAAEEVAARGTTATTEEVKLPVEEGEDDDESFCATCFTPLHPDPQPHQLFIWLHAMRYQTTEWDWSSALPYWAESSYAPPEGSILS